MHKLLRNRNTGEFVDNINWWFWNGVRYPGLLSRETFSSLAQLLLTKPEHAELVKIMIISDMVTSDGKRRVHGDRLNALLRKINDFLSKDESSGKHILAEFEEDAFDALKAYINILEFWGCGYHWTPVLDYMSEPAIVISSDTELRLVVKRSELQFLQGRPFRFVASFRGASLSFDEEVGRLVLSWREKSDPSGSFNSCHIEDLRIHT